MTFNLENDIDNAIKAFPTLSKTNERKVFIIKGMIPIVDKSGCRRTSFEVSIEFCTDFPNRFPRVFEIGNRIPRIADRHIYDTGSLCLAVTPKEILICKRGITTIKFLKEILVPHLAMQAYKEIDGNYPIGEYSHGDKGIKEFFFELFKTQNDLIISKGFDLILSNKMLCRNEICFCGSSIKMKKCHLNTLEDLKSIGNDYLKTVYNLFK